MHSNVMQTRATDQQAGHDVDSDPPRAPSRAGFMRPPLRRQQATATLEWAEKTDILDDETDWEFASTLLLPFQPSSSDDSDISDEVSDIGPQTAHSPSSSKPDLPQNTIPIMHAYAPMEISADATEAPAEVACIPATTSDDEEPYISLAVTDHGHSRSALSHLKEFWHSRYDEYAREETQLAHNNAYGGIVELNRSRPALRALLISRLSKPPNQRVVSSEASRTRSPTADPNSPIYPRVGDLCSLHDSRSATLDRVFCNYPLYSINKILFLHDMLDRSSSVSDSSEQVKGASSQEGSMLSRDRPPHLEDTFVDIALSNSDSGCNDVTLVSADSAICSVHGCDLEHCDSKHDTDSTHSTESTRSWEVDWTARWKVLLDSTKDDSQFYPLSSFYTPTVDEAAFSAALSPERTKPKFFFAEEEDEFSGLDDEDDDYGDPVPRPVYGLTAEALSKEFLRTFELRGMA